MPSSIRYPCEPFVPQENGPCTPAPQQQEEMPDRNDSRTPTPQQPVTMPATNGNGRSFPRLYQRDGLRAPIPQQQEEIPAQNGSRTSAPQQLVAMPATNGNGRSFPGLYQRNDSTTPTPQQQQEVQPQMVDLETPATQQQQEIPAQNGHGMPPAGDSSHQYPLFMNVRSQMYIRVDKAARFFTQQNGNAAPHPPQFNGHHGNWDPHMNGNNGTFPPQQNGHHGNLAPHVNGNNNTFPPQPNGYGDHGPMNGELIFRPPTGPPYVTPPGGLLGRFRTGSLNYSEYAFPPPPYYGPETHQYNTGYQPNGQPPYSNTELTPMVSPGPCSPPVPRQEMAAPKLDDPEAKLFVGDLPVRMTTEALARALKKTFRPFGECEINVMWKENQRPGGAGRTLPTAWIQYRTLFEAAKALDVAKERCFTIGNRPLRIDRADGKRICRVWPSNPRARPNLADFRKIMRQFVHDTGVKSGFRMLYHVSNKIEMVRKNYGGQSFAVPSVGVVFRWVEDADYSQQKFTSFIPDFRLKVEHVNSGIPEWREGPVSLNLLDALMLDTGEKWQEDLTLSRRRLRERGEVFPFGKMARYPERISDKLIPRSILEHPRLKKDVSDFNPLDWLELDEEAPTPRAMALNTWIMTQLKGQRNGHCNGEVNNEVDGDVSHQNNSEASQSINGKTVHQTTDV